MLFESVEDARWRSYWTGQVDGVGGQAKAGWEGGRHFDSTGRAEFRAIYLGRPQLRSGDCLPSSIVPFNILISRIT